MKCSICSQTAVGFHPVTNAPLCRYCVKEVGGDNTPPAAPALARAAAASESTAKYTCEEINLGIREGTFVEDEII